MSLIETITVDKLIQGSSEQFECKYDATILSGQNVVRGSVLGAVTLGAGTAVADEGNTGDGAMGAITVGADAQVGDYILTIIAEATNAGTFQIIAPDGSSLGQGTVGVAFSNAQLAFTLADGAEDFDIGDFFTITVADGSGKLKLCDKTATDGSADPFAVLIQDIDASSADVENVAVYIAGVFGDSAITLASGTTASDVYDAMRAKGMFLVPTTEEG